MDDLERQLSEALARQEPSAGFEARVLAAAAQTKERRWFWMPTRLRWAAAMATVVAIVSTAEWRREAAERATGEAAKAQLELALKITSEKLQKIQARVNAEGQDQ